MSRNKYLDLLKYIGSFGVVFGHTCTNYTGLDGAIMTIGCIAVPLFFMISGFFSGERCSNKAFVYRKVFKLLLLLCLSFPIAFCWDMMFFGSAGDYSKDNWIRFILFNECKFFTTSQPLWFVLALIYCYIFFYLLQKLNNYNKILLLLPLLLLGMFIGEYCFLNGAITESSYYRNFLFNGIPWFAIGIILKNREKTLICYKKWLIWGVILISVVRLSIIGAGSDAQVELYPENIVLAIALFILAMKKGESGSRWLEFLRVDLTMYIYILHLYCSQVVSGILRLIQVVLPSNMKSVISYMVTVIASYLVYRIFKIFGKRKAYII